ncbi:hypothetical protein BDZ90DRAFT_280672 [Jaminaea rosea]|uniref:BED-type domain-containing protein n=1 Tax=Jaminaea rosea TaxID=1569628 RepID=A0A316ULG2_9BASI|nr:hypothetical protein BDZ90DRAFT_280672 [Jaminaea rosea]PWN26132.1 hypothetical protein BDZ90DRAFT_280672 [Jaminaea rosea]
MTEEHQHRSPERSEYDLPSFTSHSHSHSRTQDSPSSTSTASLSASVSRDPSHPPPSSSSAPAAAKKPRTTTVWNHYSERVPISETHWEVKCLNCGTSYRIKRDGSTGTSTLHKHQKLCASRSAAAAAAAAVGAGGVGGGLRLPGVTAGGSGSPGPSSSRHHHHHQQHQHDYATGLAGGGHVLPNSIPAQALQDFLRAAQQQNQSQAHAQAQAAHQAQSHSSHAHADHAQPSTSSSAGTNGIHALGVAGEFDVAAAAEAASLAYGGATGAGESNANGNGNGAAAASPGGGGENAGTVDLLILNPNSSDSITLGLRHHLEPLRPPSVRLTYTTGPPSSPASISDPPTSILSAQTSFDALLSTPSLLETKSGVLVCCFSSHPLVGMIRHQWPELNCMHILDAAVGHALACGASSFGILTTGRAMLPDIDAGVLSYLGGVSSRYKGSIATELGVLELGDPSLRGHVEKRIKSEAARLVVERGAEAIILGCAGMAGMEGLVLQGVAEAGGDDRRVWVIDGAKAGVLLLEGLGRGRYRGE